MKKLLLALPFLTLSLTAMAADNPIQATNESIQATADQFFPVFCKKPMQDGLEAVKKCYQQTPATEPNIEQCMIADNYLSIMILANNEVEERIGNSPIYNPNLPREIITRLVKYGHIATRYKNYHGMELSHYMRNSSEELGKVLQKKSASNKGACIDNYIILSP